MMYCEHCKRLGRLLARSDAIRVDGVELRVFHTRTTRDWIELTCGPYDGSPHSGFSVPLSWWENCTDFGRVKTGGHWFAKVAH